MSEMDLAIQEFLVESQENLDQLDRDLIAIEKNSGGREALDSIFRTFHTIKGTSGFFGFMTLGAITHVAENILDQVRSGQRCLNGQLTGVLLETVDAIKSILASIEMDGTEGPLDYADLLARLEAALHDIPAASLADVSAPRHIVGFVGHHLLGEEGGQRQVGQHPRRCRALGVRAGRAAGELISGPQRGRLGHHLDEPVELIGVSGHLLGEFHRR